MTEHLKAFLQFLKLNRNASAHTVRAYDSDLGQFLAHVAQGVMTPDGTFIADEVLAKHDENYMPPEVAKALAEQGHPLPTDGSKSRTASN